MCPWRGEPIRIIRQKHKVYEAEITRVGKKVRKSTRQTGDVDHGLKNGEGASGREMRGYAARLPDWQSFTPVLDATLFLLS